MFCGPVWGSLSLFEKQKIVTQVTRYPLTAFQLRFDQAGSLYLSHSTQTSDPYYVSPIVTATFFQLEDGRCCILTHTWQTVFNSFRPFSHATDWLSHSLRAEIYISKSTHDHTFDTNAALGNMEAAVRLCSFYPGENPVIHHMKSPHKPFSFRFDYMSLKNIMVRFVVACS